MILNSSMLMLWLHLFQRQISGRFQAWLVEEDLGLWAFYTGALCWFNDKGGVDYSEREQVCNKESRVLLGALISYSLDNSLLLPELSHCSWILSMLGVAKLDPGPQVPRTGVTLRLSFFEGPVDNW